MSRGRVCGGGRVRAQGGMCGTHAPSPWTEFLTHAFYQLMTDIHNVYLQASVNVTAMIQIAF